MLAQMETILGKAIRLVDDAVRGDKTTNRYANRYAEVVRKNLDMSLKSVMAWKRTI